MLIYFQSSGNSSFNSIIKNIFNMNPAFLYHKIIIQYFRLLYQVKLKIQSIILTIYVLRTQQIC